MRRLLRAIARGEEITQDVSTLENPAIVAQLRGEENQRAQAPARAQRAASAAIKPAAARATRKAAAVKAPASKASARRAATKKKKARGGSATRQQGKTSRSDD